MEEEPDIREHNFGDHQEIKKSGVDLQRKNVRY